MNDQMVRLFHMLLNGCSEDKMFNPTRLWRYGFAGLILMVSVQGVSASPPHQEVPPCVGDPICYEPPPVAGSTTVDSPTIKPAWEGFTDGRLNPEMAEYYSVWCLDGVVRVLRGVPTTALVDDIPISEVAGIAEGGLIVRNSGLTVRRNVDTITLSGNNGNLATLGSKSFLLPQCLERNGDLNILEPVVTTDSLIQQPSLNLNQGVSGAEETPEPRMSTPFFRLLGGNNSEIGLRALIEAIISYVCGAPVGFFMVMTPAAWRLRKRRKKQTLL